MSTAPGTTLEGPALRRNRPRPGTLSTICLGWLVFIGLFALLVPLASPFDPAAGNIVDRYLPPGAGHWLGSDQARPDPLTRLAHGARSSILAAACVAVLTATLGGTLALLAVWWGGWVVGLITRVLDFLFAFPNLLLAVLAV
ncbi:ABC transporter permease, partial [Arthrobacter deserti]|nr:ABC transporter permease [Arthrobacter deserti]